MYIENKDLLEEIKKYFDDNIISEKLHLLLYNLSINISKKSKWYGYTWREDMVSDAYLKCLEKIEKFDINKSENAFNFFTTIIFNFFIDYIKNHKKHKKLILKLEEENKKIDENILYR